MDSKQRKTLAAVFADPISATLKWSDIESLLISIDCEVIEGKGSAVRFELGGVVVRFHRPHPDKETKHYQVHGARMFLSKIGLTP